MVKDPFQVLGVPETATEQEIKRAYRRKAREYHPDLHPNDPAAAQRMKEVNEAYEMLTDPQKRAAQQQRNTSGGSYGGQGAYSRDTRQRSANSNRGAGGWSSDFDGFDFADFFGFGFGFHDAQQEQASTRPREEPGDSGEIRYVVGAINAGRLQDAIRALLQIPGMGRNARWHYLLALAYHGEGAGSKSIDEMQRAVRMEPDNRLYAALLRQFINEERTYEPQPERSTNVPVLTLGKVVAGVFFAHLFFTFVQMLMYSLHF